MEVIMGSLNFEPTDEDYEFVEALLEGLDKYAEKLSATRETDEILNEQERWIESGCMKKFNTRNF